MKKDPGIPNLFPFKDRLLREIEVAREDAKDEKANAKALKAQEKRKAEQRRRREEMVANAGARVLQNEMEDEDMQKDEKDGFYVNNIQLKEQEASKRHWYFRELKKVVDLADVIIEVLDARDPMGCRCPELEKMALERLNPDGSHAKRVILVINKIDLVPQHVVGQWIKYFQREYPTLGFKASTQQQNSRLTHTQGKIGELKDAQIGLSACVGGQALVGLLKNYARAHGQMKKSITVGVVGFPNVGKSSIINSLKRARAVQVGSTPGLTKAVQTVKLDKTISLVDSPGVLFSSGDDTTLVLRNCLRVEQLQDPTAAVEVILEKVVPEKLMELYRIPRYHTTEDFLGLIAHKYGKLTKGGVPNLILAARQVLEDWNTNKIPFYTVPPVTKDVVSSVVVQQWSQEFNIHDFQENQAQEMDLLAQEQKQRPSTQYHVFTPNQSGSSIGDSKVASSFSGAMDDSESEIEEEEEERTARLQQEAKRAQAKNNPSKPHAASTFELGGPQSNKRLKKQQKKLAKQRRQARGQHAEEMDLLGAMDDIEVEEDEADQLALQNLARVQAAQNTAASDEYDFATDW